MEYHDEDAQAQGEGGYQEDAGDQPVAEGHAEDELEPLTFTSFRDEIKAMGVRKARRMRRMIQGIAGLANNNANQIANILKINPTFNGKLGGALAGQMDVLRKALVSDLYKGVGISKMTTGGALADTLKTIDTTKIVLLDTGLRLSELASLRVGDFRPDGTLHIMGKGAKERIVPIGASARRALVRYLATRTGRRPATQVASRERASEIGFRRVRLARAGQPRC